MCDRGQRVVARRESHAAARGDQAVRRGVADPRGRARARQFERDARRLRREREADLDVERPAAVGGQVDHVAVVEDREDGPEGLAQEEPHVVADIDVLGGAASTDPVGNARMEAAQAPVGDHLAGRAGPGRRAGDGADEMVPTGIVTAPDAGAAAPADGRAFARPHKGMRRTAAREAVRHDPADEDLLDHTVRVMHADDVVAQQQGFGRPSGESHAERRLLVQPHEQHIAAGAVRVVASADVPPLAGQQRGAPALLQGGWRIGVAADRGLVEPVELGRCDLGLSLHAVVGREEVGDLRRLVLVVQQGSGAVGRVSGRGGVQVLRHRATRHVGDSVAAAHGVGLVARRPGRTLVVVEGLVEVGDLWDGHGNATPRTRRDAQFDADALPGHRRRPVEISPVRGRRRCGEFRCRDPRHRAFDVPGVVEPGLEIVGNALQQQLRANGGRARRDQDDGGDRCAVGRRLPDEPARPDSRAEECGEVAPEADDRRAFAGRMAALASRPFLSRWRRQFHRRAGCGTECRASRKGPCVARSE